MERPLVYWLGRPTCSEGFVIYFKKVPLTCLGCMAAAVQPNSLWNFQKINNKTFGTSGCPTRYRFYLFVIANLQDVIEEVSKDI